MDAERWQQRSSAYIIRSNVHNAESLRSSTNRTYILYFEFILQNKSILVLGRPRLSQNTINTLKPDNKLKSTCLFIWCKHIGQCLHFRLKLIFNSSRLPLCDDITTPSLFLPYLCLSSGGPEDYMCPSAPRQAHTHIQTHTERGQCRGARTV